MKRAAKDRSSNLGSPAPEVDIPGDAADSQSDEAPQSPKRARRFSQSSYSASALDPVDKATEKTKDDLPSRSEQAKQRPPSPQPIHAKKEERGSVKTGDIAASGSMGPSSATTKEAPSSQVAAMSFPAQLLDLLQRNAEPDALWFFEGGKAIGIDRKLIDKVLNEHFRGMKFNSLVRNLNRWGFRRISHHSLREGEHGYHHLLFQRDKPHLVHRMKKDSNAKETVRQLDLGEEIAEVQGGNPEDHAVTLVARHPRVAAHPNPMSFAQSSIVTHTSRQHLSNVAEMNRLYPGTYGRPVQQQQLIWQGLLAQQGMRWQRQQEQQQQETAYAQIGAGRSMWANSMDQPSLTPAFSSMSSQTQRSSNLSASHASVRDGPTRTQQRAPFQLPPPTEAKTDDDASEDFDVDSNKRP